MHMTDEEIDQARDDAAQIHFQQSKSNDLLHDQLIVPRAAARQRFEAASGLLERCRRIECMVRALVTQLEPQSARAEADQASNHAELPSAGTSFVGSAQRRDSRSSTANSASSRCDHSRASRGSTGSI